MNINYFPALGNRLAAPSVVTAIALFCTPALAVTGDFKNTDFAAAAPYTYDHASGGGAYNDRSVGDFDDITEQLEGAEFACGDIVTFLSQIEMEASTVEPVQTAEVDFRFLANSTGQAGAAISEIVGVSVNYGLVENGDNSSGLNGGVGSYGLDSGMSDDGGSTATLLSQTLSGPLFQSGSELNGTVSVDDLEPGEKVILRIDTLLVCDPGSSPTGNLQGQLDGGTTLPSNTTINTGQQTIPFLKVGEIEGAGEPLLRLAKTVTTAEGTCGVDDVEELVVFQGDTVKYCYTVVNPGTADLYDVTLIDDNATPGDPSDDFAVALFGLADLDGDADQGDLASGGELWGAALVTLTRAGTSTNTAEASGNNGLSGGNAETLSGIDTATVRVNEVPNQAPLAVDDSVSTPEDTPIDIDVTANDADVDGNLDPTTAEALTQPTHGTLTNNGDGTFTYTPGPNFSGSDSFEYQVCDTDGACSTATVVIIVEPVNDAPVAVDDQDTTPEDTAVIVDAAANDLDVDGDLDPTSATELSGPTNGTVLSNGDGTFTYTPDANFSGTDSFTYEICDAGGACTTATVVIEVTPVNDPPVANNDSVTTDEDVAVVIAATANDSDLDGNLDPSSATAIGSPVHGSVTNNGDGTFTYTPDEGFFGIDSFDYQVCDTDGACDIATVTIAVTSVNDAPVANDDSVEANEDEPSFIDVTSNDEDVDGNLDPSTTTLISGPSHGSLTNNLDGTFTYVPDSDFSGTDSFVYEICDTDLVCDSATVTIVVAEVNDPPVARDDGASTLEDSPVVIAAVSNDSDVDGNLDPGTTLVLSEPANGTVVDNGNGTFTYTPDDDFNGIDRFTYEICDTDGLCDTATVTIDVISVDDPPVAINDGATTDEDVAVIIDVAANDSDVDGDLDPGSAIVLSGPSHGTATSNGDGTFTYTPDPDYNGADSFTYEICDSTGLCDAATVEIFVEPVKDPPIAEADSATTDEDVAVTIDVVDNDSDADGNLDVTSASVVSDAAHGTVTNNGDGTFTYTPDADYNGPDSFTYEVCDTDGLCDTTSVTIDVLPVNDPPIANDDSVGTDEDTSVLISATANDSDVDGDLDPSSAMVVSDPSHGTVTDNADGTFTYTPDANYFGLDSFEYEVCDLAGACDVATVYISISSLNDPPIATDDAGIVPEDGSLFIDASFNDTDVDGNLDPGTTLVVSEPTHGTVVNHGDGTFTYTPDANFFGDDSFVYEICDTDGVCDTATVIIQVTSVNDLPLAMDDSYSTMQDTTLNIAAPGALVNDSDVDGDALTVDSYDAEGTYGGTIEMSAAGSFSYTPSAGFAGYDTFTYTITDGNGGYDTATVTIEVEARNNRSISVDLQSFQLDGTTLGGLVNVTNQSGAYDVQVVDMAIEAQYRSSTVKQWTYVAVAPGSCSYDPALPFVFEDAQLVSFSGCELEEALPTDATVRVTANVRIYGRIRGSKALQQGWFLSRLSY